MIKYGTVSVYSTQGGSSRQTHPLRTQVLYSTTVVYIRDSTHGRYRCSTGPHQSLLQYTWPIQMFDWTPSISSSVHMADTDVRLDPINLFFSTHGRYRCSTGPHQSLLQYTWPNWTPSISSSVHMADTDVRLDPINLFFSSHGRYRCSNGPHQPLLHTGVRLTPSMLLYSTHSRNRYSIGHNQPPLQYRWPT